MKTRDKQGCIIHPGLALAQKLKALNISRASFSAAYQIPLTTLNGVCQGKQAFPLWLCDELGRKALGTRLGWLVLVRNYELEQFNKRWSQLDKDIARETYEAISKLTTP